VLQCLVNTLRCEDGQSGPTYESLQQVIDKKSFRPSVNLSTPTITNISFTLYAILGVVSQYTVLDICAWLCELSSRLNIWCLVLFCRMKKHKFLPHSSGSGWWVWCIDTKRCLNNRLNITQYSCYLIMFGFSTGSMSSSFGIQNPVMALRRSLFLSKISGLLTLSCMSCKCHLVGRIGT